MNALVYNPIFHVHLNRELLAIINILTIGISVYTVFGI